MTNEQARRASGQAMEASRRAIGTNNEAARRAIGTNNEAARRGVTASSLKRDLNSLESGSRTSAQLRTIETRGARPATRGRADWTPDKEPVTSGGIASPITEPSYAAREWWPDGILSSDGLFVIPAVKKIVAADANSAEVIFEFAEPV